MEFTRCFGCMQEKQDHPICEHCGWDEDRQNAPHQLPIGTILAGQYLLGRVLGQGGFGITYLGWDLNMERPVAVKEYFPSGDVTRNTTVSNSVVSYTQLDPKQYQRNVGRFLREAQTLMRFDKLQHIVRIFNFFKENNTVYMVMEYVRGRTLLEKLQKDGAMTLEETLNVLTPVLLDLHQVHQGGTIHRDISPDNIILEEDGSAKLLDFGAVREVHNADQEAPLSKTTEAILKQGFAPAEQYNARGSLGPWTDVYAVCATICFCLSCRVPASAPDRALSSEPDSFIGRLPNLTDAQKHVLRRGMALRPKDRISSLEQLLEEFQKAELGEDIPEPAEKPQKPPKKSRKSLLWLLIPAAALVAGILTAALWPREPKQSAMAQTEPTLTAELISATEAPPATEAWITETLPGEDPLPPRKEVPFDPDLEMDIIRYRWQDSAFGLDISRDEVIRVVFEDSLQNVPWQAIDFSKTHNRRLMVWSLPLEDGYEVHIAGDGAVFCDSFYGCIFGRAEMGETVYAFSNLREIENFPVLRMGQSIDLSDMFSGCSSLESVDLRYLEGAEAKNATHMFEDCTSLETVDLRSLRPERIQDTSGMFSNCTALKSVRMPSGNFESLIRASNMFVDCENLQQVWLSEIRCSGAENLSRMFEGCRSLKTVDLSGFAGSPVKHLDGLFEGCTQLEQVNMEGISMEAGPSMKGIFAGCESLRRVKADPAIMDLFS